MAAAILTNFNIIETNEDLNNVKDIRGTANNDEQQLISDLFKTIIEIRKTIKYFYDFTPKPDGSRIFKLSLLVKLTLN